MRHPDTMNQLDHKLRPLLSGTRLWAGEQAIQHGDTTVLLHCLAVAYFSLKLAKALKLRCDQDSLMRGALFHDYFLYDWHDSSSHEGLHGFHHPIVALKNARADLELTEKEADIIAHHMFPLTLHPPRSKEAALVCLVDKGCGLYETFGRNTYPGLRSLLNRHRTSSK